MRVSLRLIIVLIDTAYFRPKTNSQKMYLLFFLNFILWHSLIGIGISPPPPPTPFVLLSSLSLDAFQVPSEVHRTATEVSHNNVGTYLLFHFEFILVIQVWRYTSVSAYGHIYSCYTSIIPSLGYSPPQIEGEKNFKLAEIVSLLLHGVVELVASVLM